MRKITAILISLFIICTFIPIETFAAPSIPAAPINEGDMPDCYKYTDTEPVMLFANFSSPDGGYLEYQWYSTTVNEIQTIRAIDEATNKTYEVPIEVGVRYYCVGVWSVVNGIRSEPTYGRLIRVEYAEPAVQVIDVEIIETPKKLVYISGETLDLTGLRVRVWTSEGYIDSKDGEGLNITKAALKTLGEQKIKVTYGDNTDVFGVFIVTVKEAPHKHSFGEWNIVTKPTCTEEGIKTRECDCGYTERGTVPATGKHMWDNGKKQDGFILYTCTVCKATTAVEINVSSNTESTIENSSNTESTIEPNSNTESKSDGKESYSNNSNNDKSSSGFPWWPVIPIAAIALVVVCLIFVIIINIKK